MKLYIVDKKSLQPIYHLELNESNSLSEVEAENEESIQFFSGGLIGINDIIEQISQSHAEINRGISLIEHKGKFLFIEHTSDTIVCIVASKNLISLRYYLRSIRDQWDNYYSNKNINWLNAKTELYLGLNALIHNILKDQPQGED